MTMAEVPPASAITFDKKRKLNNTVNRATVAEVPPGRAVSFDKK